MNRALYGRARNELREISIARAGLLLYLGNAKRIQYVIISRAVRVCDVCFPTAHRGDGGGGVVCEKSKYEYKCAPPRVIIILLPFL